MKDKKYLTAANYYAEQGISIIPVHPFDHPEKGKRPRLSSWKTFQTRIMPPEEREKHFSNGANIAIVAGQISGNMEILDFDEPALFGPFMGIISDDKPGLADKLNTQKTPSGGHHIIYRTDGRIQGNQVFAKGPDGKKVFIETRGEGGYFLIEPSSGYRLKRPFDLSKTITPEEREYLHEVARSFDKRKKTPPPSGDKRPGDIFEERENWHDILTADGWTFSGESEGRQQWTRPGKKSGDGCSATVHPDKGLYVFSTSTDLPTETPISKFAYLTHTRFNGDFSAAARYTADKYSSFDSTDSFSQPHSAFSQPIQPHSAKADENSASFSANSASLDYSHGNQTDLTNEVDRFVRETFAAFTNKDVYSEVCANNTTSRKSVRNRLDYLEKQSVISRLSGKNATWERIDAADDKMSFESVSTKECKLPLPLGLSNHSVILPGAIILVAGEPNCGKTSFMLQLLKKLEAEKNGGGTHHEGYNLKIIYPESKIHYINSEMSPAEMKSRVCSMGGDIDLWSQSVNFYSRNHSFHQRVNPDGLTLIDYLEVVGDFTQAGNLILQVHEKLNTGISVIGLQKNPDSALGYGGALTMQKPRLYINLKKNLPHGFIAEAVKIKEPRDFTNKIEGMQIDYHITQDGQFVPDSGWRYVNQRQRNAINAEYAGKYRGNKTR